MCCVEVKVKRRTSRYCEQKLMPLSSPIPHNSGDEWDTPARKRARTLRYDSAQLFGSIQNVTGVLKQTVQRICAATSSRRNTNNPKYEEQRGKAAKIGRKDIRRIEQILEEDGFCGRFGRLRGYNTAAYRLSRARGLVFNPI